MNQSTVFVVAGGTTVATPKDSILWAPISTPVRVSFIGTDYQAVSRALQEAFGHFPIRLSKEHIPTLHGMVLGAGDAGTPFKELREALKQFGNLEITLA